MTQESVPQSPWELGLGIMKHGSSVSQNIFSSGSFIDVKKVNFLPTLHLGEV